MTASLDEMKSELDEVMSGSRAGLASADALCLSCVGLFGVDGAAVSVVLDGASSGTFGSSSATSRRLDEYQFTFGEGPCLDAVVQRKTVMAPDLGSRQEHRWPALRGALLDEGIRGVFAVPIMVTSVCIGALDLFRARPGPLTGDVLAGARHAAEHAVSPLLDLIREAERVDAGADEQSPSAEPFAELDRVEVYQATGMLIAALGIDADEALVRLRAHAIATDQTAGQVARAIIERRLMLERDDPEDPGGRGGPGRIVR
jgi:hypothetical protein